MSEPLIFGLKIVAVIALILVVVNPMMILAAFFILVGVGALGGGR